MIGATRIGAAVLLVLLLAGCGREERYFIAFRQQYGPFRSEQDCSRIRMYRLAIKGEKLYRAPSIEMLPENNARTGFFEREQSRRCAATCRRTRSLS